MAKEPKAGPSAETYGEVVQRLEEVVKRLEGGELSLEDSLKAFEDGIGLVRKGEKLLGEAEKRIEQLLEEEGQDKTAPLELPPTGPQAASPAKGQASKPKPQPAAPEDDDVPF